MNKTEGPVANQVGARNLAVDLEKNPDAIRRAAWEIEKTFFSGKMPCDDATCCMLAVDSLIRRLCV